jgi:uncharacterized RDD family membrane protein YckC
MRGSQTQRGRELKRKVEAAARGFAWDVAFGVLKRCHTPVLRMSCVQTYTTMEWYYANEGQRQGPITAEDFARLVAAGTVRADTLVWRAGMAAWQTWAEVAPTVQLPSVGQLPPPLTSGPAPLYAPTPSTSAAPTAAPALEYGGFWIRLLAKIIDGIALAVVGNIVNTAILGTRIKELEGFDPQDPAAVAAMLGLMGLMMLTGAAIGLAYHWFFLAKFSATPGKLALGLRIVRSDGSRLSHGRIVARFFAEYLSSFMLFIGYLIAGFDDQKRTLHDYICDTRVVKKDSSGIRV